MFLRTINIFLMSSALLSTISCAVELKDKNKQEVVLPQVSPTPAFRPKTSVESGPLRVTFHVRGLPQPDQYSVEVSWEQVSGHVRILEGGDLKGFISGQEKSFMDLNLSGGSKVSYLVEHLSPEGQLLSVVSRKIEIPKDILLEGEMTLSSNRKFEAHRIFIAKSLILKTMSFNLYISAEEVVSDGGLITNFSKESIPFREQNGRSGGSIKLSAEKATGSLRFLLNGEDGGDGRDGVLGFSGQHLGCAGSNGGLGGNSGALDIRLRDGRQFFVTTDVQVGSGGKAGRRGFVSPQTPSAYAVHPPCQHDASDGRDGRPGAKGLICLQLAHDLDLICR